jgi:N-acetylglucosaminyl-diphospho-decaprenol L-rhamnosyltransferase
MSNPLDRSQPLEKSSATVSVIVVAFNSQSTLASCLDSIPPAAEVIIVDQKSTDATISVAHQARPGATIIRAGANRGFGAGCNLGAANATGTVLVFLNPDASLGCDSLGILAEVVADRNALVGPTILDAMGNEQTRAGNWSNMLMDLAGVFWPKRFALGVLARDIPADQDVYRSGGQVPYVQGSCMAVSAESFWDAGGFDERYFLYYEEESLARSLASIGVFAYLEPRAVITHKGKVSTSQTPLFAVGQQYRSKAMLYSTYYPRVSACLFAWAMWSLLRMMAIATPVRRAVGLRSSQDRLWYRSAAEGVINGWRGRMVKPPYTITGVPF